MNKHNNKKVSVYCLAHNHEKYIKNTLEGFVNQKTNFDFEVFVHDDASSDNTRCIIQEYVDKYPHIIYPIYQKENQYSRGINIVKEFILPRMIGKYIAVCEGDDYWCSNDKLQKQVDFLDTHPEYSACVHNTVIKNQYTGDIGLINSSIEQYDLAIEHVLIDGGVDYHTSSVMYRIEYARKIHSSNPPCFIAKVKGLGDYPLAIFLTLEAKVRYLPDIMSVYRFGTSGSWTNRMKNISLRKKTWYSIVEMLKSVDEYTNYKLHSSIQPIIERRLWDILYIENKMTALKSKDIQDLLRKQKFIKKIKVTIRVLLINKRRYKD